MKKLHFVIHNCREENWIRSKSGSALLKSIILSKEYIKFFFSINYSKTCVKNPFSKSPKKVFRELSAVCDCGIS